MSEIPGEQKGNLHRVVTAFVLLFVIDFALTSAALVFLANQVNSVRRTDASSCSFYRDLSDAPVTSQNGTIPSKLGVTIVSDARLAFIGRKCGELLPAPGAGFVHWAEYYKLPVTW